MCTRAWSYHFRHIYMYGLTQSVILNNIVTQILEDLQLADCDLI